jgi:hypothetical protein
MQEIITTPETGWKFLDLMDGEVRSRHGNTAWTVGAWKHVNGFIYTCSNGFHCSPGIGPAMSYVGGNVLAKVEAKGRVGREDGGASPKAAYSDMRLTEAYHWTAQDSVALAAFALELVLPKWQEHYPEIEVPAKVLELVKKYLADPGSVTGDELEAAGTAAYDIYAGTDDEPAEHVVGMAYRAAWAAQHAKHGRYGPVAEYAASAALSASYTLVPHEGGYSPEIEAWLQERVKTLKPVEVPAQAKSE